MTRNSGDILSIKLIDDKNKDIEFETGEKNSNNRIYCSTFSMNRLNKKKIKNKGAIY